MTDWRPSDDIERPDDQGSDLLPVADDTVRIELPDRAAVQPGPTRSSLGGRARYSIAGVGIVVVALLGFLLLRQPAPDAASATSSPPTGDAISSLPAGSPGATTDAVATLGPSVTGTPEPLPTEAATPTPEPTAKPTPKPTPTAINGFGTLTVVVAVTNDDGGTKSAGDFEIYVYSGASGGEIDPRRFPGSATGTDVSIEWGADWSVTVDSDRTGYVIKAGGGCDIDGPGSWIEPGTTQVCEITIDDYGTQLIVRTVVDNGAGGSASPSDWQVKVFGTDASPESFAGSEDGVAVAFYPYNFFKVSMSNPDGGDYTLDQSGTCTGDRMTEEAPATCTFTYTYVPPA